MSHARRRSTEEAMIPAPRVRSPPPKTYALAHGKRTIDNANVTIYVPLPQPAVSRFRARLAIEPSAIN